LTPEMRNRERCEERYKERCRDGGTERERRRTDRSRSAPAAMTAVFRASTRVWNGGT
jgi:hypothetical protein